MAMAQQLDADAGTEQQVLVVSALSGANWCQVSPPNRTVNMQSGGMLMNWRARIKLCGSSSICAMQALEKRS
jgi:hypothetical protein